MKIDFEKLPTDKIDRNKDNPILNPKDTLLYFGGYGDKTYEIRQNNNFIPIKDIIVTGYRKQKCN